jgi:signal transduction histidine kinase
MGISLNILKAQLSQNAPGHIQSRIDDCLDLVSETTARIRDVMAELRPSVLDDYGLFSALRWYGAQFSLRTGVEVNLEGDENMKRLGISKENAFFRIAQEALTNVAKHADASRVTIHLNANDGYCHMEISDDGKGFIHDTSLHPFADNTWGLTAMHERALRIGGRLQVSSQIGKGTKVVVEVNQ